jgi:hypothetical protein
MNFPVFSEVTMFILVPSYENLLQNIHFYVEHGLANDSVFCIKSGKTGGFFQQN